MLTTVELEAIAGDIRNISHRAGRAILDVYEQDFSVTHKQDDSPLTQADLASNTIICDALAALTPNIPLLSEESAEIDFATRSQWRQYWLVDPLDGTREFVKRNGEFTVNIALISNHAPVFGVVYVPVSGVTYTGIEQQGASRQDSGQAPVGFATWKVALPSLALPSACRPDRISTFGHGCHGRNFPTASTL